MYLPRGMQSCRRAADPGGTPETLVTRCMRLRASCCSARGRRLRTRTGSRKQSSRTEHTQDSSSSSAASAYLHESGEVSETSPRPSQCLPPAHSHKTWVCSAPCCQRGSLYPAGPGLGCTQGAGARGESRPPGARAPAAAAAALLRPREKPKSSVIWWEREGQALGQDEHRSSSAQKPGPSQGRGAGSKQHPRGSPDTSISSPSPT